jgi:hypothetical protein
MNRETKRAMARQQRTTDQGERLQQLRRGQQEKQRNALKSPSTGERKSGGLHGYTIVVLVAVTIITAVIFGLDYLFGQAVVALYT